MGVSHGLEMGVSYYTLEKPSQSVIPNTGKHEEKFLALRTAGPLAGGWWLPLPEGSGPGDTPGNSPSPVGNTSSPLALSCAMVAVPR